MKLLIILMLVSSVCIGQRGSYTISPTNIPIGEYRHDQGYYPNLTYDTARVLLIVCDTVAKEYAGINNEIKLYDSRVRWQFGYEVTEYHYKIMGSKTWYIDDKKKPLPKSLIIIKSIKL